MNKKIIIAVTTATILITGYYVNERSNEHSPSEILTTSNYQEEKEAVSIEGSFDNKYNQLVQKQLVDKLLESGGNKDIVQEQIQKLKKPVDKSDEDQKYEDLVRAYPALQEKVKHYRGEIKLQREKVNKYKVRMLARNKDIKLTGSVSESVDSVLAYEKELLLLEAKRLGQLGLELNQAIREEAYNG
ncbi:MAG: hypothetical protein GY787_13390 [Alteromonadales bacterium]|nr:hypothetical protein [Alteromonadales bacterium]